MLCMLQKLCDSHSCSDTLPPRRATALRFVIESTLDLCAPIAAAQSLGRSLHNQLVIVVAVIANTLFAFVSALQEHEAL